MKNKGRNNKETTKYTLSASFPSFPQHYAGCTATTPTPCCMSGLLFEVYQGNLSNLELIEAKDESDSVFTIA